MPISLRSASGGGAGTPIGGYAAFPDFLGYDLDINGSRYLKSGYIETDTSKFDNTIFADTVGTYFSNEKTLPAAANESDYVVASADNGTNTIVAVRGLNSQVTQIYVSTDSGNTWQIVSWNIGSVRVNDVIWVSSLGLFVAVADSGYIGTSPNGTTWTTRYNVSGDGNITGITFGAGRLVAVSNGNKVITSTNGTAWAYAATVPFTTGVIDVAFGGGKFIIAAQSTSSLTSTDGNIWTTFNLNTGSGFPLTGISYGDGYWLAHSNSTLDSSTHVSPVPLFKSTDGNVWVQQKTNLSSINTFGAKSRFKFYAGYWFHYRENTTTRSKDLFQFYSVFSIANNLYGEPVGLVCFHLNKWFSFRTKLSSGIPQNSRVNTGNVSTYAGNPKPVWQNSLIGGVVDGFGILWYYVRVS